MPSPPDDRPRDAAHELLKKLREPWACGGGQHSLRCESTLVSLCVLVARERADAAREAEAATWRRAADIVDECERNRGTLEGSTLGRNLRAEACYIESRAAREAAPVTPGKGTP